MEHKYTLGWILIALVSASIIYSNGSVSDGSQSAEANLYGRFQEWKRSYGMSFEEQLEETYRFAVFKQNLAAI